MTYKCKYKFLIFKTVLVLSIAILFSLDVNAQKKGTPLVLPTRFDAGRIYVEPDTEDGIKLKFFTDTGGGLFIFSDAVETLRLNTAKREVDGRLVETVVLPKFKANVSMPNPLGAPNQELFVAPATDRRSLAADWTGMLGQQWFAGRIWTFDYLEQKLLLHMDGDVPDVEKIHQVSLGFQKNAEGKRTANFPRIQILVDGEMVNVLFDTGASTQLTKTALAEINDKLPAIRATSFITNRTFEKWREHHPEWRIIEKAENDSFESMIEVPEISIAGYTVGPVWFTRRPNKNFHEFMSKFMDRQVEGAVGGNVFNTFRITVDYPNAVAIFKR